MSDMISQAHQRGPSGVLDVAGLRRFVKVCRMPMALLNLETRLMDSVNEAFAGLLGYTPEELEGRGPAVLHADQAGADEQIAKAVQLMLQTGTVHVERELRNKRGASASPAPA